MTAFIGGKLLLLLPFASSFTLLPQFYHHVSLMTFLFEPSLPIWSTYKLNSNILTGDQLTDLFVYRPPRSPWLQLPSYTFFLSSLSSWSPLLQELCEHIYASIWYPFRMKINFTKATLTLTDLSFQVNSWCELRVQRQAKPHRQSHSQRYSLHQ